MIDEKITELFRSRMLHDKDYGFHIRYDIHTDLLKDLFKDEERIEQFAEQVKHDVLYKLKAVHDRYIEEV